MPEQHVIDRLYQLYYALQYDSQVSRIFSSGERIVINQERGSLLNRMTYKRQPVRAVSDRIEGQILMVHHLLLKGRWEPINKEEQFLNH